MLSRTHNSLDLGLIHVVSSVASIPFPNNRLELLRFRGFLGGLWTGGKLYRFATYTGATITAFATSPAAFNVTIQSQQHVLSVSVRERDLSLPGSNF